MEDLKEKLLKLYKDDKSTRFVLHLVRCYSGEYLKLEKLPSDAIIIKCIVTGKTLALEDAYTSRNTDTIISLEGIEAVREFAKENKDDQFVKKAMTINRTVAQNNSPKFKRNGRNPLK